MNKYRLKENILENSESSRNSILSSHNAKTYNITYDKGKNEWNFPELSRNQSPTAESS